MFLTYCPVSKSKVNLPWIGGNRLEKSDVGLQKSPSMAMMMMIAGTSAVTLYNIFFNITSYNPVWNPVWFNIVEFNLN